MSDTCLPKQLVFGSVEGTASRGAPRKTWNDRVSENLQQLGFLLSWSKLAKDRDEWRKK